MEPVAFWPEAVIPTPLRIPPPLEECSGLLGQGVPLGPEAAFFWQHGQSVGCQPASSTFAMAHGMAQHVPNSLGTGMTNVIRHADAVRSQSAPMAAWSATSKATMATTQALSANPDGSFNGLALLVIRRTSFSHNSTAARTSAA